MTKDKKAKAADTVSSGGNTLAGLIKSVEKEHGAGLIRQGNAIPNFTYIPTGVFMIDMALLGGLPEGCMTLAYGNPSSGKSMMAFKACAGAQRKYPDSKVLYINLESPVDKNWAIANGVDLERFYEAQPSCGEHMADLFLAAVEADDVSFIVLDSLANIVPAKEADSSAEDAMVGNSAKLQARMFRGLRTQMNKEIQRGHKIAVYCINQFRTNIGQMFGDNRTLPGGHGQHFAADVKLEMKNKEIFEKDGTIKHNNHSFHMPKNKTGQGVRTGEFIVNKTPNIAIPVGAVDDVETVVAYAINFGLIEGAGSSWTYEGKKYVGKVGIIEYLQNEQEQCTILKKQLIGLQRRVVGLPALPPDEYL